VEAVRRCKFNNLTKEPLHTSLSPSHHLQLHGSKSLNDSNMTSYPLKFD
jgi:hypothetical protein